jgi:hypothetical protein
VNLRLGLSLATCALIVAVLAAQEDPSKKDQRTDEKASKKKLDDLPQIKELERKEPGQGPAGGDDSERLRKIVERLHKNMDKSEEQLNKKDPGEDTRKIQLDIIKDLDELIKQQSKGDGGGGASSSSSASKGASNGNRTSAANSGSRTKKKGQTSKDNTSRAAENNDPDKLGNGEEKEKGKSGNQAAKSEPGKEGKGGDGMGGKPNAEDKKDKNTIADLFKDVWGHLPQKERQEMDAYARERFLRKYEEILRQYYRTISEQDRRRDRE